MVHPYKAEANSSRAHKAWASSKADTGTSGKQWGNKTKAAIAAKADGGAACMKKGGKAKGSKPKARADKPSRSKSKTNIIIMPGAKAPSMQPPTPRISKPMPPGMGLTPPQAPPPMMAGGAVPLTAAASGGKGRQEKAKAAKITARKMGK